MLAPLRYSSAGEHMRHWTWIIGIISALTTAPAFAQTAPNYPPLGPAPQPARFYMGIHGGYSAVGDHDFDYDGATPVETATGGGYGIGGVLGFEHRFRNSWVGMRNEVEVVYRNSDADSHNVAGVSDSSVEGNVSTTALMFNAYLDVKTASAFRPYVGAGIGVANVDFNDYRGAGVDILDEDTTVIAYQGIAGVMFDMTEQTALTLDYRYFATSDADVTTQAPSNTDIAYKSHNVFVGAQYRF
jgi:OOP family OmpA-OmpF porin